MFYTVVIFSDMRLSCCAHSAHSTLLCTYVWSAHAVNHQPQTQCIICICVYSLELFCSSHAGMDTFVLHSILCNKMLPPHNWRITWVLHHCTMLASKFLLLVLWVTTVTTQQETYFYVSMATMYHDIHLLIPNLSDPGSLQLSYRSQKCKFVTWSLFLHGHQY